MAAADVLDVWLEACLEELGVDVVLAIIMLEEEIGDRFEIAVEADTVWE